MRIDTQSITRPAYADAVAGFSLDDVKAWFSGDFDNAINACIECCDRHADAGRIALRCVSAEGNVREYTFVQLRELSARAANVFRQQGVRPGDVVAGLLPRTPELVATVLGAWRLGAVYQPLFTAFGASAIEHRLRTSQALLVVTDSANRGKLDAIANRPAVALVRAEGDALPASDLDFCAALKAASDEFAPVMRKGSDLFMLMSTSGATGLPKGVPVPLNALPAFAVYMRLAIDLRDGDVFWNIADPGWAYGLYYAICGPLLLGQATTLYLGGFSAGAIWQVISQLGVTNLTGSPTAYRQLIASGPQAAAAVKGQLRVLSSAGEPLNPEVIRWIAEHLDVPIHDHYGQTEMGMCVNNHHGLEHAVHPGSAGVAMPGFQVAVLGPDGHELGPNQPGELAIDLAHSPLMWFAGYLHQPTPALAEGWYRTGDSVELEADGSISFIGRADDLITSSGYRIGPFEVESALIEHPAVLESAVVGVPDPGRTEIVKAFVVLAAGFEPTGALADQLQQHVRQRLSAHAYPREIEFVRELPKTPSGKLQRFVLRKAEVEKRLSSPGQVDAR